MNDSDHDPSTAPLPSTRPSRSPRSDAEADVSAEEPPHGPVASLDAHVPPDWWQHLFGPTYLLTDGDVLSDAITQAEVDRYIGHGRLARTDRILDLCCGQGRHTLELARRGFRRVQGLDYSAFLIDAARDAAAERGLDVPFACGDARDLPFPDDAFDAVLILGNSFGYFSAPEDDVRVLAEVRRVLAPTGRLVMDVTDGDYLRATFAPRSWEWVGTDYLVCRERELADDGARLVAREVVVDVQRGVVQNQFYAERLYGQAQLGDLFQQAGFRRPTRAPMTGASEREQDLGMMARRVLIAARPVPQDNATETDTTRQRRPQNGVASVLTRYVAVVLGDPKRPDVTKLGGRFDADDVETILRLKDALDTLDDYTFVYFDDHHTLADDLQTYRPALDFVLNLCDEGFGNDPRHELHVPALLDVLGLPYTGAGPQCLACCYDKSMVRGVARELGIAVAAAVFLPPHAPVPAALDLAFPVIVKPNAADNSAGMTTDCIAPTPADLPRAVESVRAHVGAERALLVETFLPGQDLTFGVLGNLSADPVLLPITEDDYSRLPAGLPRFCGYEAKWIPDSPYWQDVQAVRAALPDATRETIQRDSLRLFERLGCRDYARFDWRLDAAGRPHLLEVNPNPGWCWDGHITKAAAFMDIDYPGVLRHILRAAERRIGVNDPRRTTQ